MAQSTTLDSGEVLVNPGTYVSSEVIAGQGNIAAAGVVTLIGEADEGPGFQDESDLSAIYFAPSQYGAVRTKYGSGRLVDAFRAIIAAANDSNISGAVNLVRMIKTNASAAASAVITRALSSSAFASVTARRAGLPGNLIKHRSDIATAEVAPVSGEFAYCPLVSGSGSFDLRANGGTKQSVAVTAKLSAPALRALMESVNKNILVAGGDRKDVIPLNGLTLAATAPAADTLVITLQSGNLWANAPAVGDSAVIPANTDYGAAQDSAIAGAAGENVASYIVTAVSNTLTSATITLKRISAGTCVADSGTTAVDLTDLILFAPMEIKNISGNDRGSLVGISGTYNSTLNDGSNIAITAPANWAVLPKIGDTLAIPSAFANIQPGFYQVSAVSANSVSAVRISEDTSGSLTGSAVVAGPITLSNQPIRFLSPTLNGIGKTLSIEGTVGSFFRNKSTGADSGLSNTQKLSQSEERNQMTYSRGTQSESIQSGGEIILNIGCSSEDATIEVSATDMNFKIGGVSQFIISFVQFKILKDAADYISSQTGWTASIPLSRFNNIAPSDIDQGTFSASGLAAHQNLRLKHDAKQWARDNAAAGLVSISLTSNSGLPEAFADKFLSGGAKNGTTSAAAVAAIDAVEDLDTNFIVPLFSKDASDDILAGETESSSTYTVDAINAYAKAHAIKMSALEMRKNRSAICSKQGTYSAVKEAAGQLASFRVTLCFQDIRNVDSQGVIKVFQPWMAAIIAAGMQCAAGYKGIVKKFANISGISVASNDFNPSNPGESKDALKAGLMFLERVPTGGFRWVSDQLTYSIDNNFVYNSLQAVYVSDLVSLTLMDRYDRLVVGKSVAEISALAALSILDGEMFNFKRLRWITSSDDAPKGYKNASANLRGGVMTISAEIKLAGLIYFVPIRLAISEVQQSASQ